MPDLAAAFDQRMSSEELAKLLVEKFTPDGTKMALKEITVNQLVTHIVQNPGHFPQLASRNGQKYLREIWAHAERIANQA